MDDLKWDPEADISGTCLQGYLESPWSFVETVARLVTASQQPAASPDLYKVSVEFTGTFRGAPFTLYDYKGDRTLHIGGRAGFVTADLVTAVLAQLAAVSPTPYKAPEYYDMSSSHAWPK